MASVVLNGPVIGGDTHNVVLRAALLHSPAARTANKADYHVIEIGVREGDYTQWVGTWDQSSQPISGATPTSILNDDRPGMRLTASQTVVVRVTANGVPDSLRGCRLNFTLGQVGGRSGAVRPLVSGGATVRDSGARTAVAAVERQINSGGLADWEESVELVDPVELAPAGAFQARMQRDSTTQISVQRHTGNWVEVNGTALSMTSDGLSVTSTDVMLEATGAIGSTAPSASTLYYVYVGTLSGGAAQVRLSATAPSSYLGSKYLGTDEGPRRWRFVGWVYMNGSTQFVDDSTDRTVVNYYNRLWVEVLLQPAYSDDNSATEWTTTSTSWTPANSGTGATASFIANGEDALHLHAHAVAKNSGNNVTAIGISAADSTTSAEVGAEVSTSTSRMSMGCSWAEVPAEGRHTYSLLCFVGAGTGTYRADRGRDGSSADVRCTYMVGRVAA